MSVNLANMLGRAFLRAKEAVENPVRDLTQKVLSSDLVLTHAFASGVTGYKALSVAQRIPQKAQKDPEGALKFIEKAMDHKDLRVRSMGIGALAFTCHLKEQTEKLIVKGLADPHVDIQNFAAMYAAEVKIMHGTLSNPIENWIKGRPNLIAAFDSQRNDPMATQTRKAVAMIRAGKDSAPELVFKN